MFYNIYYEDTPHQTFDTREYENKIVRIIVRKKTDLKNFEKFVDKLYASNVAELKIVENFQIQENEEFEAFESEDTLSILNRYVEEAEINLDKSVVQKLISEVYQEFVNLCVMFILTINGREEDGAYSVIDDDGNQTLYIFEEEDDAVRFAMMLEEEEYPEMHVMEVDEEIVISVCEVHDHKYAIITKDDLVIPPEVNDII